MYLRDFPASIIFWRKAFNARGPKSAAFVLPYNSRTMLSTRRIWTNHPEGMPFFE
jgi:hypothetical protein